MSFSFYVFARIDIKARLIAMRIYAEIYLKYDLHRGYMSKLLLSYKKIFSQS